MSGRSGSGARTRAAGLSRRGFLHGALAAAGALALGPSAPLLPRPARAARRRPRGASTYGPLQAPDANGLRLPAGFSSRVVARSGQLVPGTAYVWHAAPDGGAVFPLPDGGFVYASNAELVGSGGVGALRFDAGGQIVDAYSILSGTSRNCAGGPTPWGTWLSCEETASGHVWECDPAGVHGPVMHAALGSFNHEAAAVDPFLGHVYLTEDRSDGLLYRFTPDASPDLSSGVLEAAEAVGADPVAPRPLVWHPVPNPNPSGSQTATRHQLPAASRFDGGEGAWYEQGSVYVATKGDDRVWRIDAVADTIEILYDGATSPNPLLSGVDNVFVTPARDVFVAEDGGNMEIVALTPNGSVVPVLRVEGHGGSEITGPALDPSGRRLYFSSQRGSDGAGVTFEVTGPFV
jgi:secreted PhoX family phosphatase